VDSAHGDTWIMRTPVMLYALTEGAQLIRY
jgi:hypothetical protein